MLELYGASWCPHTHAMREELKNCGVDFVERDVEDDPTAYERLLHLTDGDRSIPILVRQSRVVRTGQDGCTSCANIPKWQLM
jgi:glutaredoxin